MTVSATLLGTMLHGTAAARPAANAVAGGTVYSATDTGAITQSDGSSWATWATIASGLADPMTTRGDLIIRNPSNVTARLPIGTAGKFLGSDGTDVSWTTAPGGNPHDENDAAVLVNATSAGDAGGRADHFAGTSLGGAWSSEGTALTSGPTVKNSVFSGRMSSGTNNYTEAFTPSGAFRIEGRVRFSSNTNNEAIGIGVRDSSSGETNGTLVYCLLRIETAAWVAHTYSVVTNTFTDRGSYAQLQAGGWPGWVYLAIARDGSNNWTTFVSGDRVIWIPAATASWSQTITIAKIVLRVNGYSSFDFLDVVS